jgi:hypothetical protein
MTMLITNDLKRLEFEFTPDGLREVANELELLSEDWMIEYLERYGTKVSVRLLRLEKKSVT